jgi:hypothetical protein
MRPFRFSILQLLLAATLVALVLGLLTSAWRASRYQSIEQACFSPSGEYLAARFSGGGVFVWRLDKSGARLIARAFGKPGLFYFDLGSIHFVADDKLLNIESQWAAGNFGTHVQQLDLGKRQVADRLRIDSASIIPFSHACTADHLMLFDWSGNGISSFSLQTGRLERKWLLPSPSFWQMAVAAKGTTLAVCDQTRQDFLIDIESDRPPLPISGGAPLAVSDDGQFVATTSMDKVATIFLHDTADTQPPGELEFKLLTVKAVAVTPDNSHLLVTDGTKVESYDLKKQQRLPPIEVDPHWLQSIDSCVLSPAGNRLANYNSTEIVVYDLPGGKARHISAGGPRLLEIVIFTLGFVVWSVIWGIVAKRERQKQPPAIARTLPTAVRPQSIRPVPVIFPLKRQLIWLGVLIGCSMALIVAFDINAYTSVATGLVWMLATLVTTVGGVILLVVALAWIGFFIKGPHQMTLNRLRRLAGDAGRLRRCGRLTFWFVGHSRAEPDYQKQLDETLTHAEELFGRSIEPKQRRLIACLDRQCDLDAFFGRHVPLAAVIPRFWTDRLAIVCEETAAMQLMAPSRALRSALAFSIVIEQKRDFLPGWVATLVSQWIARDERRPAELRGAIRRLEVLLARQPNWDPRHVFCRSPRERVKLWLALEERPAWLEIHAETDLLLTLGEMLLGPNATPDRRQKILNWLRAASPKDDPLAMLTHHVGLTLDQLLGEWRQWLANSSGLPYDALPAGSRWLLDDVALPTLANRQLPVKQREQMLRQLGAFYVAGAPALIESLTDPKIELRHEAAQSLELLSGETWGDDLARWQAWWQSIPASARGENASDPLGRMVTAAVVGDPAGAAPSSNVPRSTASAAIPKELTICWSLMLGGGLIALLIPIALLFTIGPIVYPMIYYSLFAGVAGIVRGAARDTLSLSRVARLQMINALVCDPFNLVAGWIEYLLLRRPHVQQYLLQINGGRL